MFIGVFLHICAFGGADYKAVVKQGVAVAFLVADAFARKPIAWKFPLPAELLNEGCADVEILRDLRAVKSLSLASGCVDVCVLSYFLLAIRKISPCQIFKKMNCRKIAQKRIGRRKNDTKIKVCRF